MLGRIPSVEEHLQYMGGIAESSADTYRYLNFDRIGSYQAKANEVA